MFSAKEILERLQAGDSTEAIAQEMADALNEAVATKAAMDEAAKAERRKKEEREREKALACQEVADRLNWVIENFYDYNAHITTDDIVTMLDNIGSFHDLLGDIGTLLFDNQNKADRSPDDIIADFIKNIDL